MTTRGTDPVEMTWEEFVERVGKWMPDGVSMKVDGAEWFSESGELLKRGGEIFARCTHCDKVFTGVQGAYFAHDCPVALEQAMLPTKFASLHIRIQVD